MITLYKFLFKFFLFIILFSLLSITEYSYFYSIYTAQSLVITIGSYTLDLCTKNPLLWENIKLLSVVSFFLSNIIISTTIISRIPLNYNISNKKDKSINNIKPSNTELQLFVGKDYESNTPIFIPEKGLYQNILITGTIGTGKTSSAMYPFTKQLIDFNSNNPSKKLGFLILDVKGNYHSKVMEFAKVCNRLNDVITIEVNREIHIQSIR